MSVKLSEGVTRITALYFLLGMVVGLCAYGEDEPILLYSQAPEFVAADVSSNILICQKGTSLYGRDMDSGEDRWRCELPKGLLPNRAYFGQKNFYYFDSGGMVNVCSKKTGELLFQRKNRVDDEIGQVDLVPCSDWIQLRIRKDKHYRIVMFSLDGTTTFETPVATGIKGCMPDGKTMFGLHYENREGENVLPVIRFWEAGTTTVVRSHPLDFKGYFAYAGILPSNQILFREYRSGIESPFEPVVMDMATGEVKRNVFTQKEEISACCTTSDGAEIVLLSRDKQTVWLLDSTDGTSLATLNMPGHTFLWDTISYDSAGNGYIVSKDGESNAWLWAVAPDASPRKIFDGSQYFSGTITYFKPPYFLTTENYDNPLDENVPYTLISIFRMEDGRLRKIDAWPVTGRYFSGWNCSDDMQHCVGVRGHFLTKHTKPEDRKFIPDDHVVYERGKTDPIIEFRDYRLTAISPDGNHIAVRDKRNNKKIIHVDSGKEVGVFSGHYEIKVFSPNGNRVAAGLTVVNLEDGYRQVVMYIPDSMKNSGVIPVQFSADGSRLLSRGKGRAWLHDTGTGELLATFVESKRLVSREVRISGPLGFVNGIVGDAVNLASNFTDYAKEAPWLDCAFAANDTQVLTIAMDQLIRVWDAQSGKQLRTIKISGEESDYIKSNFYRNDYMILSPNGAYAYIKRQGHLWDIVAGRMIGRYNFSTVSKSHYVFSDDSEGFYFWESDTVYYLPVEDR